MIRLLLWLILFGVLWLFNYLTTRQSMDLNQKKVTIQVVLFSDLAKDDHFLESELQFFSCTEAQCFVPALTALIDREYFRYTKIHPNLKIQITRPINRNLLKLRPQSSRIDGLKLVHRLWKEFRIRRLSYWESDIRLFVDIQNKSLTDKTESSVGSSQGRVGYIEWRVGNTHNTRLWNITKVVHELGHIFGASDKYDGAAQSRFPEGVVQPELGSGARQIYVEIMSGTRPTGPNSREAEATDINQLAFGPASAIEMGWMKKPQKK
jgi:hypothetical protein